jgi:DNA replication protein DnaC
MELEGLLEKLKMETLSAQVDTLLEQAAKRDVGYREFLIDALKTEWHGRNLKTTEGRMRLARFPWIKTVEAFDFSFQPSIDRKVVRELSGLSFVERAENVIFLGPPGVGKTHLAIALGVKAVEAGNSALFLTIEELTTRLAKARSLNRLEAVLAQLARPKLLVLDELGYLSFSREEASSLFRLLARRYERGAVIITSNKSFADWGEIFSDTVLASAILDRLLHHSTTINIKGESFRLKEKRKAGMLGSSERREDKGPAAGEWPFDEEKKPELVKSGASTGKEVNKED